MLPRMAAPVLCRSARRSCKTLSARLGGLLYLPLTDSAATSPCHLDNTWNNEPLSHLYP